MNGTTLASGSTPTRMTVAYISGTDWYLYNFRRDLLRSVEKEFQARIVCICPKGSFSNRLQAEGWEVMDIPMSRQGLNPLTEIKTLWAIVRCLIKVRPTIVHTFSMKSNVWGVLAARLLHVPRIIASFNGLGPSIDPNRSGLLQILSIMGRIIFNGKNINAIFQNQEDLELVQSLWRMRASACHLIRGSGVDLSYMHQLPIPNNRFTSLFIGRLLRPKGIIEFFDVAAKLSHRNDLRFLVAGALDTDSQDSLSENELNQLRTKVPGVELLGHVEDIRAALAQSHVVVLPSTYGEGVPRSLIEAAACGRPLIAYDHTGCRDIVHHGVNGILVSPHATDQLADAVAALADDPVQYAAFAKAGRERVARMFSFDSVRDATFQVYRIGDADRASTGNQIPSRTAI